MAKRSSGVFPRVKRNTRPRGGALVMAMPGIPQCMYAEKPDDKWVVCRYLVPDSGTISGLTIFIEELGAKESTLEFLIVYEDGEVKAEIAVKAGLNDKYADKDFEVLRGDRLMCRVADHDLTGMTGIWVSFVFKPRADSKYITKVGAK